MATTTHTETPGPELLEERSLLGIFVHLFALIPIALPIVAAVYVLSDHPYTVENARNALNWHLTILGLILVFFPLAFYVWDVFVIPAALVFLVGGTLSWIFGIVATAKAIFGTAWEYPLAPELL
ncbi:hypothetical protein L593_02725 [Salinarchaeum sp. Harcht-Bsk1]|uniref:DUF4870 domain-containing protein n=1 Tax=Salinarchaeum sp. Harcht-Bsk1 TaxID=1333523 RepID=UPI0003422CB7|nr:DUF4870 domain-containing protein [Salinarchaeum sp. Harcht-Bsk1]AGN00496.1 hypothetical protein L593_02725 [Salinarchaeum sp. Harcht-Bsk1]